MKKIINIHIFVIALAFSAFGQNINIQCDANNSSQNCFLTDPTPFESSYFANINDGVRGTFFGWSRSSPVWEIIGDDNATKIDNGTTTKVKWSNTPNSPIRKIKVTVTYSKTNEADFTVTAEKDSTSYISYMVFSWLERF